MFNRFATTTRKAVIAAAEQARAECAEVTDEHLLRALVRRDGAMAADLLATAGVTESAIDTAFREAERKGGLSDAEATTLLTELGIDVDHVVTAVEQTMGEGALMSRHHGKKGRFTATAKDILRGALAQAAGLRAKELREEHLLLAIAAHDGVAAQLLAAHGLTYLDIRARLTP